MNRFFSKLDLRDIKIDPRTTRFLPDAEDDATDDQGRAAMYNGPAASANGQSDESDGAGDEFVHVDAEPLAVPVERPRYVPSWATAPAPAEPEAAPAEPDDPASEGELFVGGDSFAAGDSLAVSAEVGVERSEEGQVEVLKVSARSRPSAVAGAIAGVVRENGRAEVQAIGAGATNQAVKAVAIARDYLRETGIEAICLPAFIDVTIENEDRTAIRLVVEPR